MDPITPGIIAGLAVNAVTGLVGQVARSTGKKESLDDPAGPLALRVRVDLNSIVVPVINQLQGEAPEAHITLIAKFLRTAELSNYLHGVAVAVASGEVGRAEPDLTEELSALLVLCARTDPAASRRYAPALLRIFIAACSKVIDHAQRSKNISLGRLRDQAIAEKNSGYLKSLAARTRQLRQWAPEDLAAFYDFGHSYREVLHAQTCELVPAYFEHQRRVPITQMYIEPTFKLGNQRGYLPDSSDGIRRSLSEIVSTCFRTVVLGDPGAGKSTLARKVAHDLSAGTFGDPGAGIVPFVITLRRYEEAKRDRSCSVIEYLTDNIREDYQIISPAGAVEYLLLTGRAFVIFDGLDELLETHRRQEIVQAVESFASLYSSAAILTTSRRVGYWEAPLAPSSFRTTTLCEFSSREVEEYVQKWFMLDDSLSPSEQRRFASAFLGESETIPDLRANPLMLSLLCNVYRGMHSIPRNRAELYDQCARLLFERWDASRGLVVQGPLKGDAKGALQDIALWAFVTDDLAAGIPERKLRLRLARFFQRIRYESAERAGDAASQLLELWKGRAWILTDVGTSKLGEPIYKFTHQTFLEYFAAVELVRTNPTPNRLWNLLGPHIARGEWDIVAQIATQILDQGYEGARDSIYRLISKTAATAQGRARLNTVAFAARHLGTLLPGPAVCRMITRAAIDLLL